MRLLLLTFDTIDILLRLFKFLRGKTSLEFKVLNIRLRYELQISFMQKFE